MRSFAGASIPLTILGGSDRRPGELPRGHEDLHALGTYKGLAIHIGGRPLIAHLVARLRVAGGFAPIAVAGPAQAYGALGLGVELIDTDASLVENFRAAVEHHGARSEPLAILACDVLPSAGDLRALRAAYADAGPCALWLPLVRAPSAPESLGTFAWKPTYPIAPERGAALERILPGHLAILRPRALRLDLLYRLMAVAYAKRNRSVARRSLAMLGATLLPLVAVDCAGLLRLRAPTLAATVIGSGLRLARRLRQKRLDLPELERLIARIFVLPEAHELGVHHPFVSCIRLAEDLDTEEEVRALGGALARGALA